MSRKRTSKKKVAVKKETPESKKRRCKGDQKRITKENDSEKTEDTFLDFISEDFHLGTPIIETKQKRKEIKKADESDEDKIVRASQEFLKNEAKKFQVVDEFSLEEEEVSQAQTIIKFNKSNVYIDAQEDIQGIFFLFFPLRKLVCTQYHLTHNCQKVLLFRTRQVHIIQ
jgi:hypothetical protein